MSVTTDTPVLIGTCSWKFDSWKGIVYPETAGADLLHEYARQYGTVEIDQWFWSLFPGYEPALPKPEVVAGYAASVPETFTFTVKVPNSITLTHYYSKKKAAELQPNRHFLSTDLLAAFLDRLSPIRSRIGALMFQFEYLNRTKMPNQEHFHDQFRKFARSLPADLAGCIETRNPNYLNRSYFEFLRAEGLYPVFLSGYYMPPVSEVIERHLDLITRLAVIRLHGPDRQSIEKKTRRSWDRIVEPRDVELDRLAGLVREMAGRGIRVIINVNNHYEGCAPLTIERLRSRLS